MKSGRRVILALILTAQTVANVGPLAIPAIASVIRRDLGLTLPQAGSILSAYYLGPMLMSLSAALALLVPVSERPRFRAMLS